MEKSKMSLLNRFITCAIGAPIVWACVALAQTPATGSISGRVLSEDGRTLHATVTLSFAKPRGFPSPPRRTSTDANGAFTFTRLSAGTYALCVQVAASEPAPANSPFVDNCVWPSGQAPITVSAGQQVAGVVVTAPQGAWLQIRADDPDHVLPQALPAKGPALLEPELQLIPKDATSIVVNATCHGTLFINYGCSDSLTNAGVVFSHTYTAPSGYTGSFYWVQTLSTSMTRTITGGTVQNLNPNPCVALDGTDPYSTSTTTSDSPAIPLPTGYSDTQRSDSFTMTLMFEPAVAPAIFVPIASVPWSWAAHATSSDGGTTWTLAGQTAAGTLSPSATTTFPKWDYNFTSCHF